MQTTYSIRELISLTWTDFARARMFAPRYAGHVRHLRFVALALCVALLQGAAALALGWVQVSGTAMGSATPVLLGDYLGFEIWRFGAFSCAWEDGAWLSFVLLLVALNVIVMDFLASHMEGRVVPRTSELSTLPTPILAACQLVETHVSRAASWMLAFIPASAVMLVQPLSEDIQPGLAAIVALPTCVLAQRIAAYDAPVGRTLGNAPDPIWNERVQTYLVLAAGLACALAASRLYPVVIAGIVMWMMMRTRKLEVV
jgi:hypothetical protein